MYEFKNDSQLPSFLEQIGKKLVFVLNFSEINFGVKVTLRYKFSFKKIISIKLTVGYNFVLSHYVPAMIV